MKKTAEPKPAAAKSKDKPAAENPPSTDPSASSDEGSTGDDDGDPPGSTDGEDGGPNATGDHRSSKDEICSEVAELFVTFGGKRAGAKTMANKTFNLICKRLFDYALRDGYFRFPQGLGALRVTPVKGGVRTVPRTGDRIMTADRHKLVYQMGKNVKAVLNEGVPDSHYIDADGNKIDKPAAKTEPAPTESGDDAGESGSDE